MLFIAIIVMDQSLVEVLTFVSQTLHTDHQTRVTRISATHTNYLEELETVIASCVAQGISLPVRLKCFSLILSVRRFCEESVYNKLVS